MTNFVPGARVMVRELETQNSPFTFAPTEVLPVLSDVTLPFTSSSSIEVDGQLVPVLVVSLKLVLSLFPRLIVPEVAPFGPRGLALAIGVPGAAAELDRGRLGGRVRGPIRSGAFDPRRRSPCGTSRQDRDPGERDESSGGGTASMIRFLSTDCNLLHLGVDTGEIRELCQIH